MGSFPMVRVQCVHSIGSKCWKSIWHLRRQKFQFRLNSHWLYVSILVGKWISRNGEEKLLSSWINILCFIGNLLFPPKTNQSYFYKLELLFSTSMYFTCFIDFNVHKFMKSFDFIDSIRFSFYVCHFINVESIIFASCLKRMTSSKTQLNREKQRHS